VVAEKKEVKQVTTAKPSMLLPSRQQNINIVISKVRLSPIAIVEALIAYDEKVLTIPICELLIPILPNESEISQVDAFEEPEKLADSDQFVLLVSTAPGYVERFKAIIFKSTYKEEALDLLKKIEMFFTTFDFILNDKRFHKWLEIILAYGNYLNGTSNRGGTYGFKLDTLPKLSEFKSNDNKKTLLYYIIEYIGEVLKMDELLGITKELDQFSNCKNKYINIVSLTSINDSFKELTGKFKLVCTLKEKITKAEEIEEEDRSVEFLESFFNKAKSTLETIEEKIKQIEAKYASLVTFFGDTLKDMPLDTFIEIFVKFNKDLTVKKFLIYRRLKSFT
jgi:hypothetical protein